MNAALQHLCSFHWALRELGWSRTGTLDVTQPPTGCFLEWSLRHHDTSSGFLTAKGQQKIASLVRAGMRLLDRWPGSTSEVAEEWLGKRFYFSNAKNLDASSRLSSIVSSHLGRNHRQLPHWPRMLQWAFQTIRRDHSSLLRIEGTTMHHAVMEFAKTVDMDAVDVVFPAEWCVGEQQTVAWIGERLNHWPAHHWSNGEIDWKDQNEIFLSPQWDPSIAHPSLSQFPLRDRVAVALADRVLALTIRPKGTIAGLLERRLSDDRFPRGTVFVVMSKAEPSANPLRPKRDFDWLDRGAVGVWSFEPPGTQWIWLSRCRLKNSLQFSAPASRLLSRKQSDWPYLAHCTRGSLGRLPQESEAGYYRRLWLDGGDLPSHPLVTLLRILREGRLRSTTWLTRGNSPTVSLTAVPLDELLSRRQYQSHVGRWDWEPYGLLFHKRFLTQARPVLYGAESDYNRLSCEDRVYFQPANSKYDWSQEREWRVAGDLDFRSLPPEAVTVFVRRRVEAVQLARESPFPVLWIEGNS